MPPNCSIDKEGCLESKKVKKHCSNSLKLCSHSSAVQSQYEVCIFRSFYTYPPFKAILYAGTRNTFYLSILCKRFSLQTTASEARRGHSNLSFFCTLSPLALIWEIVRLLQFAKLNSTHKRE